MNEVRRLLGEMRSRLLRERAVAWASAGAAVAAVAALGLEVLARRWPLDPAWPALAICAAAGLAAAGAGWVSGWPSWAEAALAADLRLGGQERLVTALEHAAASGALVGRQRQDAAEFAGSADRGRLAGGRPRLQPLAVAAAAGLMAAWLALLPNPALSELRAERAARAAQDQAAGQIDELARQAAAGARPGEDPSRRQALVHLLRQAATAARRAPDPGSALASLSQAQEQVGELKDPGAAARQDAAAAAGAQLAGSGNAQAQAAGQALAQGQGAAAALDRLARSLAGLSDSDRQALAGALDQAAAAGAGDPALAQALQDASQALRRGDLGAARSALARAGAQARADAAGAGFTGDANQAVNGLQQAKQPLAGAAQAPDQAPSAGSPGSSSQGLGAVGSGQGREPGSGQGGQPGLGPGGQPAAGQGQPGQGSVAQGSAGQASGGGGAGGSGARPPPGTEPVYVPGQAAGSPGGSPAGSGQGSGGGLVPYGQVLGSFRSQALGQIERSDVSEQRRQLVESYFSNLGGSG